MRAKTVNESINNSVSYEEAVELAKEITKSNPRKILGPSVGRVMDKPGEYYVETGGEMREYRPEDLEKLLHAMEVVEDKHDNVIWVVVPGDGIMSNPAIRFNSDQKRKAGDAISKYYKDKPSGGYTGD